jgi:predicted transposase YbfD/YdcC
MNNEINLDDMAIVILPDKEKSSKLDKAREYAKTCETYIYFNNEKRDSNSEILVKLYESAIKELQDEITQLKTDKQNYSVEIAKLKDEIDKLQNIILTTECHCCPDLKNLKEEVEAKAEFIIYLKDKMKQYEELIEKLKKPIKIDDDLLLWLTGFLNYKDQRVFQSNQYEVDAEYASRFLIYLK